MTDSHRPILFVSHAREDRDLVREIHDFAHGCLGGVEWWDDSEIAAGADWNRSIEAVAHRAAAALILVSQHSLRSDYIWVQEVPLLRRLGIPFSWLKVRECPWDLSTNVSVLRALQALRDPNATAFSALAGADRDAELTTVTRQLAEFVGQRGAASGEPPPDPDATEGPPSPAGMAMDLEAVAETQRKASLAVFTAIHDLATKDKLVSLTEINAHPELIRSGLSQPQPAMLRKTLITLLKAGLLPGVQMRPEGLLLEEEHFALKTQKDFAEKQAVAKEAVKLVRDGAVVVLDAGSTTLAITELLGSALATCMLTDLTVVTHSPAHAVRLLEVASAEGWTEKDTPLRLVLAGGVLRPETEACVDGEGIVGPIEAIRTAVESHPGQSIAFVGANGITPDAGYTTADVREAEIKTYLLRCVEQPYVVADGMKLGKRWAYSFGDPDHQPLITNVPDPTRNVDAAAVLEYLGRSDRHVVLGGKESS